MNPVIYGWRPLIKVRPLHNWWAACFANYHHLIVGKTATKSVKSIYFLPNNIRSDSGTLSRQSSVDPSKWRKLRRILNCGLKPVHLALWPGPVITWGKRWRSSWDGRDCCHIATPPATGRTKIWRKYNFEWWELNFNWFRIVFTESAPRPI